MKIEAKGTLTIDDYTKAIRVNLRQRWWIISLLFFVSIFVGITSSFILGSNSTRRLFIPVFILLVVYGFIKGIYCAAPSMAQRVFKQQKDLQIEHTFQLDDEHFSSSSSIGNGQLDWSHFLKWKLGKDFVLLYRSDALMHILPKRFFKDGDFETLIEFLKTKLPQR